MMRARSARVGTIAWLALALTVALPRQAATWEPATTHAGLTEQAATAARLHERLRAQLGLPLGLYAPLTVPPLDAPELFETLARLNPTHGYVPDTRGRQSALAWLVAGSVVADLAIEAARRHFYDPTTGRGLTSQGARAGGLFRRLAQWRAEGYVGEADRSALDWVGADDNPLGVGAFLAQYERAVSARTVGERERHLAAALIAAGAVLHVLQDMGVPSRVRDDFAAHTDPLGDDPFDVGSRFERIAALALGRLGVPAPSRVIERTSVRGFFSGRAGGADDPPGHPPGLADHTAARWFSAGSVPRPILLPARATRGQALVRLLATALRRSAPAPDAARLDLIGAATEAGARLVDEGGVCVAGYHVDMRRLRFTIDDDCALEQIGAILPEVAAFSAGLLDFLFRGELAVTVSARHVTVTAGLDLGAGTVRVFWDDERGVRSELAKVDSAGATAGQSLAQVAAAPAEARGVAALFVGADGHGEPVIATGIGARSAP
jgi:hypothetical protein